MKDKGARSDEQREARLNLEILQQPDESTCGPTCLHAIYRYYGESISLAEVVKGVRQLEQGGTFAVDMACHALKRGYRATIYTYNVQIFDPTWLDPGVPDVRNRLEGQLVAKANTHDRRLHHATRSYVEFLSLGGRLRLDDLTAGLIRKYLNRGQPLLTGLSATYLYRTPREYGDGCDWDDIRGEPSGHFVVLAGYNRENRTVLVADPMKDNPVSESRTYEVSIDRLVCSILLGILTYDANLLILEPAARTPRTDRGNALRR